MKHHEYAEYIRSRTDLGPDQKSISIQHDLDRRKGTSTHSDDVPESKDTTEPEKPTAEEFEPIERFEYNGISFVAGEEGGSFWVAYSGSKELDERVFEGPADSLEEAIEDAKATQDLFDKFDEGLGLDEYVKGGAVKVRGKEIPYSIRKEGGGFHAEFHPPHGHKSGHIQGSFDTIEEAESETVQQIKSAYSW